MKPITATCWCAIALALPSASTGLDLLEAYKLALAADPQLAQASLFSGIESDRVDSARSALLPQINAQFDIADLRGRGTANQQYDVGGSPVGSDYGESRQRATTVTLEQALLDINAMQNLRASLAREQVANHDFSTASIDLMVRVSVAYFNGLAALDALDTANTDEQSASTQLRSAQARFDSGAAAITDTLQARARLASVTANRIVAENAVADAYDAIRELIGVVPDELQRLGAALPDAIASVDDVQEWERKALQFSPELAAARSAVAAANADLDAAKAMRYPTISANVTYGDATQWGDGLGTTSTGEALRSEYANDITLGLQVRFPIFSGFAVRSGIRTATKYRSIAESQVDGAQRRIENEVRSTHRAHAAGRAEIEARKSALESAAAALQAAQVGFEMGTRSVTELLLVQQQRSEASLSYAQARYAYVLSYLRLAQAAGTLNVEALRTLNEALIAGE